MGDVAHIFPIIYASLENHQEDHQASIIEMEGKVCNQIVSLLIDRGSKYN